MADKHALPADQPPVAEAEAPARKQGRMSRLLIMAGILLAQVVIAYFVQKTFVFTANPLEATAAAHEASAAEPAEPKDAAEEGETSEVVMLDEIIVNPADTGGRRYLAITVGLQMRGEEPGQVVERHVAVIRDALISLLAAKHLEQLADIRYRDSLKVEIKEAVNGRLAQRPVEGVVFSGYVLQ